MVRCEGQRVRIEAVQSVGASWDHVKLHVEPSPSEELWGLSKCLVESCTEFGALSSAIRFFQILQGGRRASSDSPAVNRRL